MIKLRKGRMRKFRCFGHEVELPSHVPSHVRNLTDPYLLEFKWWEAVECGRKALLLGVPTFMIPGEERETVLCCTWRSAPASI